jgi:CRP/FNR family transcriptional regulator, cyclic AMP receptor protein
MRWDRFSPDAQSSREEALDPSRLKDLPLFREVSEHELREIAPFADEVAVQEGEELVKEGDFSYEFMAIEEGEADVFREGEKVATLGPGDYFGEMGLLERDRRNATVVAKTPVRLITLTGWDLKRMEKSMPQALVKIRQTMEQRR